jgi:NADH-quinone oxidoreductase subunit N
MFDTFAIPDLLPALPEIFLLVMALAILLIDLGVKSPRRTLTFAFAQIALAGTAVLIASGIGGGQATAYAFDNMFVRDLLGDFLKFLSCLAVMATLFYSRRYVEEREAIPKGEYLALSLFATLGMLVMISANHFLTLYLGLEILSLSLYALVALNRANATATEAAMKYFVLGALASGFLLYGMSMLYGVTGSLEITEIVARAGELLYGNGAEAGIRPLLVFGLVFIVAGLAFKLGVVPFHMWIPDVYHGAPTSTTLFIASASKLAAFAIVIRLLVGGLFPMFHDWQPMLMLLSVLSMGLGNIAAVMQNNIKRMLAYSAISHMGFMLLGLCAGMARGVEPNMSILNAYSSSLFYIVTYVLTTLAAFGLIMLFSRPGFEAERLEDYRGLNQRNPWFAAMMMILMLSMAGIPFFVGFFAKFSVLSAVVLAGHYWLAVLAVFFSLIGAFYYLRVIKLMYFDDPPENVPPLERGLFVKTLLSLNSLAIALIGIFPHTLMDLCVYVLVGSV